ncbi:hypothetical protein RCJ22_12435, partial [Vibrio sp. FNV 38]|nr:hypothetical protein [Vibrio sp. FNV 38]
MIPKNISKSNKINLKLFNTPPLDFKIEHTEQSQGHSVIITIPEALTARERVSTALAVAEKIKNKRLNSQFPADWVKVMVKPNINENAISYAIARVGLNESPIYKESIYRTRQVLAEVVLERGKQREWIVNQLSYVGFSEKLKKTPIEVNPSIEWQTLYLYCKAAIEVKARIYRKLDTQLFDKLHNQLILDLGLGDGSGGNYFNILNEVNPNRPSLWKVNYTEEKSFSISSVEH